MEKNTKFFLGLIILLLITFVIAGYAYTRSRQLIRGPQITLLSPQTGGVFDVAPITLEGSASNVSYITLNDRPIFIDSKGSFSEKLLLLPGYNILTLKAGDRFGKKTEQTLELTYNKPPENSGNQELDQ